MNPVFNTYYLVSIYSAGTFAAALIGVALGIGAFALARQGGSLRWAMRIATMPIIFAALTISIGLSAEWKEIKYGTDMASSNLCVYWNQNEMRIKSEYWRPHPLRYRSLALSVVPFTAGIFAVLYVRRRRQTNRAWLDIAALAGSVLTLSLAGWSLLGRQSDEEAARQRVLRAMREHFEQNLERTDCQICPSLEKAYAHFGWMTVDAQVPNARAAARRCAADRLWLIMNDRSQWAERCEMLGTAGSRREYGRGSPRELSIDEIVSEFKTFQPIVGYELPLQRLLDSPLLRDADIQREVELALQRPRPRPRPSAP